MTPIRVEKLRSDHAVERFACGQDDLDRFRVRFALANQSANASQSYVLVSDDGVIGFYTLVVGSVAPANAPERLSKGMARYPIPLMILARMAVDRRWQGKGLGAALVKDAMKRTLSAADIAGIRAMAVHAKDDSARAFYEHFGFEPSPVDPLQLYLLLKDIRRVIGGP